jgi:hypothetical protein
LYFWRGFTRASTRHVRRSLDRRVGALDVQAGGAGTVRWPASFQLVVTRL